MRPWPARPAARHGAAGSAQWWPPWPGSGCLCARRASHPPARPASAMAAAARRVRSSVMTQPRLAIPGVRFDPLPDWVKTALICNRMHGLCKRRTATSLDLVLTAQEVAQAQVVGVLKRTGYHSPGPVFARHKLEGHLVMAKQVAQVRGRSISLLH